MISWKEPWTSRERTKLAYTPTMILCFMLLVESMVEGFNEIHFEVIIAICFSQSYIITASFS
jgi:hypothetical protein